MSRRFTEARRAQLLANCRTLAARVNRAEDVSDAGVSAGWRNAELHPHDPAWGVRYVVTRLLAGAPSRLVFDFDILSHSLGALTPSASALVDAAFGGPDALVAWGERYGTPAAKAVA